jgi:hypothetical protein
LTAQILGRPHRSTANGWRPNRLDKARLVYVSTSGPCQAIVGDVVTVFRLITPPTGFYNDEPGCLWIRHWGGSNATITPGTRDTGTAGIWELVQDETLSIDGTPIDRVTPEYRVFLLAEAVRGLAQEEREAVLERVEMSAPSVPGSEE